jgi:predicted N-acyltransferase
MLCVRQYKSIHEVDPEHWNSILDKKDVFHAHGFIKIVEDSRTENAVFHYLLIYDNDQLVATTVLSAFKISLDLFISKNKLVSGIRKICPNFFTIRILVCGLPASFGQLNIKVTDKKYTGEVSHVIAETMKSISRKMSISLMAVKEFRAGEMQLFVGFEREGFFPAHSIPYMNLKINWTTFSEYLSSLKHNYRRRILLSLKKINHTEPVIAPASYYNAASEHPALVLSRPGDEHFVNEFYRKYLEVMKRTPTKLETLNREFFSSLFKQENESKLLNLVVQGKVVSSAVVIFAGDELVFMLVAKENDKDEYDSYFNLVYGIIALAIQNGCKKISMGQTAYWVKQCVGAVPEPESIYFASRKRLVHWILKSLRSVIFPETKLKSINVFRQKTVAIKEPAIVHEQFQDA